MVKRPSPRQKGKTFETLNLSSTPRSEKVFDICVDMETVLPDLVAAVRTTMAGDAYRYLEGW